MNAGWRRRGVYRAMYQKVREMAAGRSDVCGLRLYVDQENEAAQRAYECLGMYPTRYQMYEASEEAMRPTAS